MLFWLTSLPKRSYLLTVTLSSCPLDPGRYQTMLKSYFFSKRPGYRWIILWDIEFLFTLPFCCMLLQVVLNTLLWLNIAILPPGNDPSSHFFRKKVIPHIWKIGADAKVFIRLLTDRFAVVMPTILLNQQADFLTGCFTADNGVIAHQYHLPGIALLLGQRRRMIVSIPSHLCTCLLHFGFPSQLVDCVSSLLFGTSVYVNASDFLKLSLSTST